MAPSTGNAVAAEWVGPSGHQLFDGTVLNPGTVVVGIGKDEVEASDYWKSLGDSDAYTGDSSSDVSGNRDDWSFGVEEGGAGTGRPLTDSQVEAAKPAAKSKASVTVTTPEVSS